MPVDQYGIRADIIIDPQSIPHRMNGGALYEVDITRTAVIVQQRAKVLADAGDYDGAWNMMIEFVGDVNHIYRALVEEQIGSIAERNQLVREWINDRIYIQIVPGLKKEWETFIPWLVEKWGAQATPVTYTERNHRTGYSKTVVTDKPVMVGPMYMMLLYKMPEPTAPGIAYTSQHGIPVKPTSRSVHSSPISLTPLRYGEDEFRIQIKALSSMHPFESPRFLNLMSNSPTGVSAMVDAILNAPNPAQISRVPITTKELIRSSTIISQVHHLFSTVGVGSEKTAVKLEADAFIGEE